MALQQRKSNIELLRIIAMGMIVIYHIFIHGIAPTEILPQTILSILYIPVIFGVNIFVIISGYFGIRLSWKSFLSLMWIIAFYKLFHLCCDTFFLNIEHPIYEWILKPFCGFVSGGGWFIDIYVLLMLISPLLNKLLFTLNRHDYWAGLGILLLFDIGYGFFLNRHFNASGYSLLHFILLYYIGNLLQKKYLINLYKSGGGVFNNFIYHIDTVLFFTRHTMGNKISHILFFTSCFNWLYLYIYIFCQSPYQLLSYHQFYSQFYTTYLSYT